MRLLATKIEDFRAARVALAGQAVEYYTAEWDDIRGFGILEVVFSKNAISEGLVNPTILEWNLVCRGIAPIHFFRGLPNEIRVLQEATLFPNTNTRYITVEHLLKIASQ